MDGKAIYITPGEIAVELRVSVGTVSGWLRKGMLRGIKVGKFWRIRLEDYHSFLDAQTNTPMSSGSPCQQSQASRSTSRSEHPGDADPDTTSQRDERFPDSADPRDK